MKILTPSILRQIRQKVKVFLKELEDKKIQQRYFYDRYDMIVDTIRS